MMGNMSFCTLHKQMPGLDFLGCLMLIAIGSLLHADRQRLGGCSIYASLCPAVTHRYNTVGVLKLRVDPGTHVH